MTKTQMLRQLASFDEDQEVVIRVGANLYNIEKCRGNAYALPDGKYPCAIIAGDQLCYVEMHNDDPVVIWLAPGKVKVD